MMEYKTMRFFYGAMIGVPLLMLVMAIISYFPMYISINYYLGIVLAIGCIVYGVLGFREVFIHG